MTKRNYILLALILGISTIHSCSKEEDKHGACNVADPINQLSWLNEMIKDDVEVKLYGGTKIYSYKYNGSDVIYIYNPASSLGTATRNVYDCSGTVILANEGDEDLWDEFDNGKSAEKLLWQNNK